MTVKRFIVAFCAALAVLPTAALGAEPPAPTTPVTTTQLIHGGPGNQTDPHISGSLVSYSTFSSVVEIRYHDLATGANNAIPSGGHRDNISDVFGSTIVFRRVFSDRPEHAIMAFDTATPALPPVELDPAPGVRRHSSAIGGRTVAWRQFRSGQQHPQQGRRLRSRLRGCDSPKRRQRYQPPGCRQSRRPSGGLDEMRNATRAALPVTSTSRGATRTGRGPARSS